MVRSHICAFACDRFLAVQPSNARQPCGGVSPDGARHWPTVVAKTKDLWTIWIVLDPTELRAIQVPVLVIAGDQRSNRSGAVRS